MLKDILTVPDSKGLTVWSDKEAHWDLMKRDSFLVANDGGWMYNNGDAGPVLGPCRLVQILLLFFAPPTALSQAFQEKYLQVGQLRG